MHIRLTLPPHQRGAKQLLAKYGNRLLCVRYRYDSQQKKRLKTVELIEEERPWNPEGKQQDGRRLVYVQGAAAEGEVRRQVKGAGGRWRPQYGVWELPYEQVVALQLGQRIVGGQTSR